ncbi:hypothetical protein SAMN04489844_0295 [Nocardioides exalbidus]|uniref:DUF6891 domain-containing protein n=1 Tax=Nocardioides exalbidus TaxID=402596 RepID=A0A1H4JTR6_9ACTN|nr:hypothetical protein [Nocardioides exalbidus]SEB49671.1 hypothetical protein SAMN04489844_0295 [Nocardioides exalbidus]
MGFLDRFRRAPSTPAAPVVSASSDVSDDDVREAARERVLPGFMARDDVVAAVGDYLEIEGDPRVERVVGEIWDQRRADEDTWTGPGDFARVEAAFADLAEQGVVGRMSFTCCQTCGTAEIDDERTPLADVPDGDYAFREWGYTFFHEQDAERLADDEATLYLSYSTFCPAPDVDESLLARWREGDESARGEVIAASDAAVGHRVADALRARGLEVTWAGDTGQRVEVAIRDWRKPLPR